MQRMESLQTAGAVSSRTSSGSRDLEIIDGLPVNSSPRASISTTDTASHLPSNATRLALERVSTRDLEDANLICSIRIHLPKVPFQFPSSQCSQIPMATPDFFTVTLSET